MHHVNILKNRIQKFIDNPGAIFYFLRRVAYDQFTADRNTPFYKKLHFLTPEETFNYIIDNNVSVVRFGDGEFGLMRGAGVYFNDWHQRFNKGLKQGLFTILSSPQKNLLICLPGQFLSKTKLELEREGRGNEFKFWINGKIILKNLAAKDTTYGNSFAFYLSINTSTNYNKLKSFLQKRDVIIITSNTARFKDVRLGKTTNFIEAPKSDAWEHLKEVERSFFETITAQQLHKEDILVMVSMGPAAKVFAYDLAKQGYVVWDAGQFFDLAHKEIEKLSQK